MADLRSMHTSGSAGISTGNSGTVKTIGAHGAIEGLDKYTREAGFHIWGLRLKNALKQYNPMYNPVLELIERLPVQLEHWESNYGEALREHSNVDVVTFAKLSGDLY